MFDAVRSLGPILAATIAIGCSTTPSSRAPGPAKARDLPTIATTDAEELHAFAKLYGYVRFFHPSDEVAAADWNRIAVDGARRVVAGGTRDELRDTLVEIFAPLAPTLVVVADGEAMPPAPEILEGPVIAWQHIGYGFGVISDVYHSGRTERPRMEWAEGRAFGLITRSIDAARVRGKRVRVHGWARVAGRNRDDSAQLWLRVDAVERGDEFSDDMRLRPITSTEWQRATLESPPIGPRARTVVVGMMANGPGPVLFDDVSIEAAPPGTDEWSAVPIDNGGFEAKNAMSGWQADASGHDVGVATDAHEGRAALQLVRRGTVKSEPLFAARPKLGETFERRLGAGLRCRVVFGLPRTEPRAIPQTLAGPPTSADDPAVRAAAVIVAWNVLRHFYPYHDVIGHDWDAVLAPTIADVLDDEGPEDLFDTLSRLVHQLQDGHGHVRGPVAPRSRLPIRIARIEGEYVVLAAPADHPIARHDVLVSIDGVAMDALYDRRAALAWGSPQYIEHRVLMEADITEGTPGSRALVELRRDGEAARVEVERVHQRAPEEFVRPTFEVLAGGIIYVDLVRIPQDQLQARMRRIAKAPGVIIDVRGYPESDPIWLPHFLGTPDRAKWMALPLIVRPDGEGVEFFGLGWDLDPAAPQVLGEVAFLSGPGAISYAESLMGYVEGYRLGHIVGRATAGANGNISPFDVPGGFRLNFTGMKVTRMDGRQHHIVGVQPTLPVQRTLAGIRAGRDEELEAALARVREGIGERRRGRTPTRRSASSSAAAPPIR